MTLKVKAAKYGVNTVPKKKAKFADDHHVLSRSKGKEPANSPVASSSKGKEKAKTPESKPAQKKTKAKASSEQSSPLPLTFKVVAGSYEKLLYGLEGSSSTDESGEVLFHLKPIFAFPAHVSCVKAVSASPGGGKWLATGSADEIIKVWDLRRRKEIGGLMHHEGSITQLTFPSRSHLISASEDGTLCLFRARDWSVLRTLKGHKGRVNSVAVHPSSKVALSVGKDRTLRMWDLMRGKGSASVKIGKEGEVVRWSTTGSSFVLLSQQTIDIYATDMTVLHTIHHPSRLQDVKFCRRADGSGEVLLIAAEDKKVSVYDFQPNSSEPPTIVAEMVGHSNRVKAVDTLSIALPSNASGRKSTTVVSTVSSDGKILIFDLSSLPPSSSPKNEKKQIDPVAQYDTSGTRLTCLTLAEGGVTPSTAGESAKRKREESDVEDEVQGEEEVEEEEWDEQEVEDEDEEEVEEEAEEDEE